MMTVADLIRWRRFKASLTKPIEPSNSGKRYTLETRVDEQTGRKYLTVRAEGEEREI